MALRIVFLLVFLSFVLAYIPNSVRHRSFDLSSSSCFLLLFFFFIFLTRTIFRGFFFFYFLLPLFLSTIKKKEKKVFSVEKRANTLFRDAIVRIPKNSTNSPRAASYFDFNFRPSVCSTYSHFFSPLFFYKISLFFNPINIDLLFHFILLYFISLSLLIPLALLSSPRI